MRLSGLVSVALLCATAALGTPTDIWRRADNVGHWSSVVTHKSLPGFQLRSQSINGVCDAGVRQMSGYLDTADDKHFFFWFFEAQNQTKGKDTELAVWLNGGPGCSSLQGALLEVGPCMVADDGKTTVRNPHAWNQNANLLFIDQPTGVGFSYGAPVGNSTAAATDFVALMQLFYKKYPEYYNGGFHVFGESYGGHYIPTIGAEITESNKQIKESPGSALVQLPLKSLGIGNGLFNIRAQFKYYSKMGCDSTYPPIFAKETCDQMDTDYQYCAKMLDDCEATGDESKCIIALNYCMTTLQGMLGYDNPDVNPYDVRIKCEEPPLCYPSEGHLSNFLNQTSVQKILNARETDFQLCSTDVQSLFGSELDYLQNTDVDVAKVLEAGIPVLIYNGDADYLCNWYGVKATMLGMDWSGKAKFNSMQDKPWVIDNKQAGELRASGGLTFLRVFAAGHMVPSDQPLNALAMFNHWVASLSI